MGELIPIYVSQADKSLFDAQKKLEEFTELEAVARDAFTESKLAYQMATTKYIKDHKKDGSLTVLKEVAQSENFELYSKMVRDESNLKNIQSGKELHAQRINTSKIFIKIKFNDLKGFQ